MSATSHYHILPQGTAIRPTLSEHYRCDEEQLVKQLIPQARVDEHAEGIKTLTKKTR